MVTDDAMLVRELRNVCSRAVTIQEAIVDGDLDCGYAAAAAIENEAFPLLDELERRAA